MDSPEREDTLTSSSPSTQTTVLVGISRFSPTRKTVGNVTAAIILEISSSSRIEKIVMHSQDVEHRLVNIKQLLYGKHRFR